MKRGKVFFSIISAMLGASMVQAQYTMPEFKDVNVMKGRQLIVEVARMDDALMKKIDKKDPGLQAEYKKLIDYYNVNMKAAAEKFWKFSSKGIVYKTGKEINDISKDKNQRDNYVVMYCHSEKVKGGMKLEMYEEKNAYHIGGPQTYFSIAYPGQNPVVDLMLELGVPSAREVAWAVSTTNYNFNYVYTHKSDCDMKSIINENAHILKQKTLLIVKNEVNPKVIDNIGKYYPGKVKLVEYKEMIQAIATADTNCVYVIWTEYNANSGAGTDWIVNCADGATLAHRRTGNANYISETPGYKKDFFEEIAAFYNAKK